METPLKDDIRIFPDHEAASLNAASLLVSISQKAVAEAGSCSIALSGGSTPSRMLHILGSEHTHRELWKQVHVFWVDERCVPPDSSDSNFGSADELFLSQVSLPEGNIHRIIGEDEPSKEAARYEKELRKAFPSSALPVFDLIILGIGMDGHTASLFPDTDAVYETERLVVPAYGGSHRGWRITLTFPVINNARNIIFLVTGSEKAGIVSKILSDDEERDSIPAGLVGPEQGKLIWLLDEGSARRLKVKSR